MSLRDALEYEAGPMAVGALVGLAGLWFLLEPVVAPVALGPLRVRPVALSAVTLAAAFCLGAVVFYRRGRRLFAFAHGIFGLAWAGLVVGVATGSGTLLLAGVVLVVAGSGFLVSQSGR
jgi:hypothetical protein